MTRVFGIAALAVLALAVSVGVAIAAQAGDLDPEFDGDGKRVLPVRVDPGDVLAQPDGKILVTDSRSFSLLRLNPDGSLDRGFDGDGVVAADFGAGATGDSVALQPDGRIIVAGTTASFQIAVARFNPNGTPDATFDPGGPDGDGKRVYSNLAIASAGAVLVQPDGRIVITGSSAGGITAVRLGPTGALDGTSYEYADNLDRSETVNAATLTSDGSLVVAGVSRRFDSGDADAVVARFKDDGTLDKSLGGSGIVELGPANRDDSAVAVFVQPDGKIVLAGDSGTAERKMAVTRLNASGTPDDAFGDGGTSTPDFDGQDYAVGAGLQPDGKILVAGTTDPGLEFAVARLDSSGQLDPGFGSGGKTTIAFDDIAIAYAAGLQPDNKFVVAGLTVVENHTVRTAVARVLADQPPEGDGGDAGGGTGDAGGGTGDAPPSKPRCGGKQATIVGTAGRDTLRGTRRADVIVALGGNDRVLARGGNDLVCGGRGHDRLAGGPGADRLLGGPGRDLLNGGKGRDRLIGGTARDLCVGGAARDTASGCETKRSL